MCRFCQLLFFKIVTKLHLSSRTSLPFLDVGLSTFPGKKSMWDKVHAKVTIFGKYRLSHYTSHCRLVIASGFLGFDRYKGQSSGPGAVDGRGPSCVLSVDMPVGAGSLLCL